MASNAAPGENGEHASTAASAPAAATAPASAPPNAGDADNAVNNPDPSAAIPAAIPEGRLPTRKDASIKEFLGRMDDYAPIIPDAVTNYYMTRAGLPPPPQTDARLARLLALATQKFVADIAADAYQYSRMRASNSTSANNPMGNLGAAAGFPVAGQPGGAAGQAAGGGAVGKDAAAGGAGGAGAAGRGPLGIQRAGYGGGGQGGSQNRTVLTMEDLGMAVGEYGVNLKRSEFYR